MNWLRAVEDTVTGLGYDLVDAEKGAGGLLRVYIDQPAGASGAVITVDDCEKVTRQLQHVLEVENVAYERLEVSSPGLDRPLNKPADYARFVGEQVVVTLKLPFQGRKKYSGELQAHGEAWRLVLADDSAAGSKAKGAGKGPSRSPGKVAKAPTEPAAQCALDFSLDEVREARLVPVLDFKGRRFEAPESVDVPPGTGPHIEVDGGRLQ